MTMIMFRKMMMMMAVTLTLTSPLTKKRFDGDDSGSIEAKELSRLLFTLIDNGIKV